MSDYRLPFVLCLLVAILMGVGAAARVEDSPAYAWPEIVDHGPAPALSDAALLSVRDDRALLWPPLGDPAPLIYTSLVNSARTTNIISYDDVQPRRWEAVPAGELYHLVWEETGGVLRSALIQANGDTIRGPVDLTANIGSDLVLLPAPGGQALVLWTTPGSEAQLASLVLDRDGRPGPITPHSVRRVQHVAAVRDTQQRVHLVWLTAPTPDTRAIHYHRTGDETFTVDDATTLYTAPLAQNEAVSSFALGLDQSFGYVVVGITTAAQPDVERVEIIAFPLAQPQIITHSVLGLPATTNVSAASMESTLMIGHIAVLQPDMPTAALRWPYIAPGQHDTLVLALAIKQQSTWQPGIVFFQAGTLRGYQIVAKHPADAGPTLVAITASGDMMLTWLGLHDSGIQRYTAFTAGAGWSKTAITRDNLLARTLSGIGVGILLSLLWLVLPTLILLFAPSNDWMPLLLCAVYGTAKLLWPPDLFTHVPPLLAVNTLQHVDAAWIVGGAVTVIMLLAGISALIAAHRKPLWHAWSIVVIIDLALTWIVFGAALAP